MDAVANLLKKNGFREENPLELKNQPGRRTFARGQFRFLVGPLWATHYRVVAQGQIEDIDSVRTENLDAVAGVVTNLLAKL